MYLTSKVGAKPGSMIEFLSGWPSKVPVLLDRRSLCPDRLVIVNPRLDAMVTSPPGSLADWNDLARAVRLV